MSKGPGKGKGRARRLEAIAKRQKLLANEKDYIENTIPLKAFTDMERTRTIEHLQKTKRYARLHMETRTVKRTICALLCYLWETEEDEDRKEILLEVAWMGRRMSMKLDELRAEAY